MQKMNSTNIVKVFNKDYWTFSVSNSLLRSILCSHVKARAQLQFQFSFSLFTLEYNIYIVYRNLGTQSQIKGEKKEVNGFGRSVRWSEELSFRANHRYIINEILLNYKYKSFVKLTT